MEGGQIGGTSLSVGGGQQQVVYVASTIGEAPSADVLPAGDPLDHVEDTLNLSTWMQPAYEPPANVKTHYDQLIRLYGLITPKTLNVDRFKQRVADDLITLAKAAYAVKLEDV